MRHRSAGKRLAKLEALFPPEPAGPRKVRILVPYPDGSYDPGAVPMTEADCEAAGEIWIPDHDDRPEPADVRFAEETS